jgi:hypothetical protein
VRAARFETDALGGDRRLADPGPQPFDVLVMAHFDLLVHPREAGVAGVASTGREQQAGSRRASDEFAATQCFPPRVPRILLRRTLPERDPDGQASVVRVPVRLDSHPCPCWQN